MSPVCRGRNEDLLNAVCTNGQDQVYKGCIHTMYLCILSCVSVACGLMLCDCSTYVLSTLHSIQTQATNGWL